MISSLAVIICVVEQLNIHLGNNIQANCVEIARLDSTPHVRNLILFEHQCVQVHECSYLWVISVYV